MVLYVAWAVKTLRNEATAEASLAAIFERSRFGMAIAAIIRMIATTIKSSIREKPFCLFRMLSPSKDRGRIKETSSRTLVVRATVAPMSQGRQSIVAYYCIRKQTQNLRSFLREFSWSLKWLCNYTTRKLTLIDYAS